RVQSNLSKLDRYEERMYHLYRGVVEKRSEQLRQNKLRLQRGLAGQMKKNRDYLEQLNKRIELVDPRNVLKRGYSMTLLEGKSISSTRNIKLGDRLETRLYKGNIISIVENRSEKK
ncbi:MAG: exodeoxyribonuclease VII large subunit, partial [bacterium]